MTERIERIGSILSLPKGGQLIAVTEYIRDFHAPSFELMMMDRAGRGKLGKWSAHTDH